MRKYFSAQCKRLLHTLPGAVCVVLVLMGALLVAYTAMVDAEANAEENQKIHLAICGSTDDPFLQMGMMAITSFDNTRFSIELQQCSEEEAKLALQNGDLAAYAVIPDGFMEQALHGNIMPLRLVSTTGNAGLISVFKEEVSQVFSTLLLEAQKGVYGMMNGFWDYGVPYQQDLVNELCFTYVDYVLERGNTYTLQELGISDMLGMEDYLLCGLAVLLMLLTCLPFAPVLLQKDRALSAMLAAKGIGHIRQALAELAAYGLALLATVTAAGIAVMAFLGIPDVYQLMDILSGILPALLMAITLSFCVYSISSHLISGVLLQFFLTVALCFVSGCMYPVFFFPMEVQRFSAWLPTGLARSRMAVAFTGTGDETQLLVLMAYCALFAGIGIWARVGKCRQAGR